MNCKIGHVRKPEHPSVLAVIPARGGSKRLPGKNLLPLRGRPLLAYSILAARGSDYVARTVVTSDSPEILGVAAQWGAEIVVRTPEQASDEARTIETVRHALEVMEERLGRVWDYILILQANCPLRKAEDIDQAIVASHGSDGCLTVDTVFPKFSPPGHFYRPEYTPGARKQEMTPMLRENGCLYLCRRSLVLEGRLFGETTRPITDWPRECSLANIDYEYDLKLTEAIFEPFGWADYFDSLERRLCLSE